MNEVAKHNRIDELEAEMLKNLPPVDCPVIHTFTPGLYSRQIFMPAGSLATSRIHQTEHQFTISLGSALVKINDHQWERLEAPYNGKTQPGTRRILYIESDCIWTCYHPTDIMPENDSEEAVLIAVGLVEEKIIEKHENYLLNGELVNNELKSKEIYV